METIAYKLGMAGKREHRNVRLPTEQMQLVQKLAEWRHAAGIDDQVNWTAALSSVIRFFEVLGGFDAPQEAMNKIMDAAKDKPKKK